MRPDRRTVLLGAAATLAAAPLRASPALPELRAAPSRAQLAPAGYPSTEVWSYGGAVPGPEIRVRAGERVGRRLVNDLPQPTAVHWHGIRIENAMDGAAPLTQAPVEPGGTFDYDFVAPDPGTYWYHAHDRGWEQVARGLAGPLIVEDRAPWLGLPGAATREMTLVLDDWRLEADAAISESFGALHDAAHAGRLGNTATVNGAAYPEIALRPNERVRLRLINAATARIMPLALPGLNPRLVALDGHPVAPRSAEGLILAPAQRADVVVDMPAEPGARAPLLMDAGRGDFVEIAGLAAGGAPLPSPAADLRPLPAWEDWPEPDLADPMLATLLMEGGAMRGLPEARFEGRVLDGRALAAEGMVWAFNGAAMGMGAPLFDAPLGRTVRMALANRTAFAHAIHLHGHHFRVLARNGAADPHRDVRDTVLIDPEGSAEIAFVADNPGDWMIHCHMLAHQSSGMMARYRVGREG